MASSDADAATQALIARMIAEDFGEAYEDQTRPVGSWYGDYEDPLTSYERGCIENPGQQNVGGAGWGTSTPSVASEAEEGPSTLPQGATWDSGVNEDTRIESTPYFRGDQSSDAVKPKRNQDEELDDEDISEGEESADLDGPMDLNPDSPIVILKHEDDDQKDDGEDVSIEQRSHQLHHPIRHHGSKSPSQRSPRRLSQPNYERPSSPFTTRRNISDPPRVENVVHENYNYPPTGQFSRLNVSSSPEISPKRSPKRRAAEPISLPIRSAKSRRLSGSFTPAYSPPPMLDALSPMSPPSLVTNERLLDFYPHDTDLVDYSRNKNKGKAPEYSTKEVEKPVTQHSRSRHQGLNTSSSSQQKNNKGKARATIDNDDGYDGDTSDADFHTDPKTGLLFYKVPWPGSTRADRKWREHLEKQVTEIRIGEGETLDSILMDIARSAKGKGVAASGMLCC